MNGGSRMNPKTTIRDGTTTAASTSLIDTYTTIVRTSRQLFMEFGYRGVSTRQIADACGITQPALYHHFRNKQALYLEVIKQSLFQTEAALTQINMEYFKLEDRLTKLSCYMMGNFQEDISQMFHDIHHELDNEKQQQVHQWWLTSFLYPVEKMIEDGMLNGQLKKVQELDSSTTEIAYLILNLIKSALPQSYTRTKTFTDQQQENEKKAKVIVSILLNGIST